MIPGLRGRLITASFVRDLFPDLDGVHPAPSSFRRAVHLWWERTDATLGPASSIRAIADGAVIPLLDLLGLRVDGRSDADGACVLRTNCSGQRGPDVLVVGWHTPLSRAWRTAVLGAIASDGRWSFCTNGTALRFVDARRSWSRDFFELDLTQVGGEQEASLLWALARGASITAEHPLLDRAVEASARHGADVCRALGDGVLEAVAGLVGSWSRRRSAAAATQPDIVEHAITVLYRILFLLFAEARGLVPVWHPLYRDRYSLDAIVAATLAGRPCRGLWQAVQAMARLAQQGCTAGSLRVNAFNGRLFSPSGAGVFDRMPIPDAVMAKAIMAVSTQPAESRRGSRPGTGRTRATRMAAAPRTRVLYRDLDVEQLGAVYEQVLEYAPALGPGPDSPTRTRDTRKSSGTFYTPRTVTAFMVRQALAPLVEGRQAAEILGLRIVDPAMGSGAFLVAACRYLSSAAEDAARRFSDRRVRLDVPLREPVRGCAGKKAT
jgi:hypothetical protein